ncbi:MAG: GNAT family N-acetyltransferase [Luteitalea sp.]|nr:GNAT family N-acetyltransferase [Luteitalea sp.]
MSDRMERAATAVAIRLATVDDAAALTDFARQSFLDTFAADNTPENMALYVAQAFGAATQTRELTDEASVTLLVEQDGQLVAYAQMSDAPPPACVEGAVPMELRRLYVDRGWQGQGLALPLIRAIEAKAVERGARTMWLGVWDHNTRAIAFYRKAGYVDVGWQPFVLGRDVQQDRVMARHLE